MTEKKATKQKDAKSKTEVSVKEIRHGLKTRPLTKMPPPVQEYFRINGRKDTDNVEYYRIQRGDMWTTYYVVEHKEGDDKPEGHQASWFRGQLKGASGPGKEKSEKAPKAEAKASAGGVSAPRQKKIFKHNCDHSLPIPFDKEKFRNSVELASSKGTNYIIIKCTGCDHEEFYNLEGKMIPKSGS